jgi:hypothetical protein
MRALLILPALMLAGCVSGCAQLTGSPTFSADLLEGIQDRCVTDFTIALGPVPAGSMTAHCEPVRPPAAVVPSATPAPAE